MTAEGWQRRFNWGNAAAWKSDWTINDDDWVDDVDFASTPATRGRTAGCSPLNGAGTGSTTPRSDPSPTSRATCGARTTEWVVIAACGPLEDDVINGGGNVHSRWIGAFDGLHLLLGYAAVTYDNTERGRRVALYARQGMTVRRGFRTAEEIQPSTNGYGDPYGPKVYAAAMWVGNATANNADDHLWGHGSVGPDIRNHTWPVAYFALLSARPGPGRSGPGVRRLSPSLARQEVPGPAPTAYWFTVPHETAAAASPAGESRIPREIWVLIAAAFVIAIGYGLITPVLPSFAQSFLWARRVRVQCGRERVCVLPSRVCTRGRTPDRPTG